MPPKKDTKTPKKDRKRIDSAKEDDESTKPALLSTEDLGEIIREVAVKEKEGHDKDAEKECGEKNPNLERLTRQGKPTKSTATEIVLPGVETSRSETPSEFPKKVPTTFTEEGGLDNAKKVLESAKNILESGKTTVERVNTVSETAQESFRKAKRGVNTTERNIEIDSSVLVDKTVNPEKDCGEKNPNLERLTRQGKLIKPTATEAEVVSLPEIESSGSGTSKVPSIFSETEGNETEVEKLRKAHESINMFENIRILGATNELPLKDYSQIFTETLEIESEEDYAEEARKVFESTKALYETSRIYEENLGNKSLSSLQIGRKRIHEKNSSIPVAARSEAIFLPEEVDSSHSETASKVPIVNSTSFIVGGDQRFKRRIRIALVEIEKALWDAEHNIERCKRAKRELETAYAEYGSEQANINYGPRAPFCGLSNDQPAVSIPGGQKGHAEMRDISTEWGKKKSMSTASKFEINFGQTFKEGISSTAENLHLQQEVSEENGENMKNTAEDSQSLPEQIAQQIDQLGDNVPVRSDGDSRSVFTDPKFIDVAIPDKCHVPEKLVPPKVLSARDSFVVYVDISCYESKNISLKMGDGKLYINATQQMDNDYGGEYKTLHQVVMLPLDVDKNNIKARLASDGKLLIQAPIVIPK